MPYPDTLPPEIWHHTVSIAKPDVSDLIPWLKVAPFSCAKGMHDAAFAHIFRTLHVSTQQDADWLHTALRLARYSREDRLRDAVRSFSCSWNAGYPLQSRPDADILELRARGRSMKMMEELTCSVLDALKNLQSLEWSNFPVPRLPIREHIYTCLERHFPSLKTLTLEGTYFDDALDLRAATCLSNLILRHVRLTSTPTSPPILLDTKIENLLLTDVQSREISNPWWREALDVGDEIPREPPSDAISHIVASFDLSRLKLIFLSGDVSLSLADMSYLFPAALSPDCQLTKVTITQANRPMITALSKCGRIPRLTQFRIYLVTTEVISEAYAAQAISSMSSFIGKQTALKALQIGLTELYKFGPEDFEAGDTQAYKEALASDTFRDAIAHLKNLRRFSLATYHLWSGSPILDSRFSAVLPALETLFLDCVIASTSSGDLTTAALALDCFPILGFFRLSSILPEEDGQVAEALAEALPRAIRRHAPRVKFCAVGRKYVRLRGPDGVERVTFDDADSREVYRELRVF